MVRELKHNLLKNISFVLLIALSIMIIIGFNRSMDIYIATANQLYADYNVEDGQFSIYGSLTKKQEVSMERRFKVVIEENKSIDYALDTTQKAKKESGKDRILRTICSDKDINKPALILGAQLKSEMDVMLDPKFAIANHYAIGDDIIIRDNTFHIVGYGISPDYVYTLKNASDFLNSPETFGVAYVTEKGFEKIDNNEAQSTLYSYQSQDGNILRLKDYLEDHTTLLDFREKDDNSRIKAIFDDANGPKQIATVMGVLLVIIVAFILSISIKNTIRSESQTIGILYAQGFNAKELMGYYMLLPALLVLLGALSGYGGGMLISRPLILMQEAQYSIPFVKLIDSWGLIAVGIVFPMLITLGITFSSLSKALNKTPLSLLHGSHSNNNVSKIEKFFTFKGTNFFTRFRLKDMIRERGSMIALLFGVLLSMMILSTAIYIKDSCQKYVDDLEKNVPFKYLYTFTQQKDLSKYSKKGELSALKNVKINFKEDKKSLVVQGIKPKSEFFNMPLLDELKTNETIASPSLLLKFNLHIGDQLILIDDLDNKEYNVVIKGTATYDYGQYLYTNIKTFNHIFKLHEESYNALVTNQSLDVKEEKLSSLTNKDEMINGVTNLLNMISVMSGILVVVSIVVLMIVIYMLMQMIIDKAKVNISMVKIFGYTPSEVSKLYLRGNFIILVIGFVFAVPAGYSITKGLYGNIMANMQQYISPYIKPVSVLLAFIIMTLGYWGTCFLLKRNLNRVLLTEALKNRE